MTREEFGLAQNVSRETLERLSIYVDLLTKWNRQINLVSQTTLGDVWRRHILDSSQVFPLLPRTARILVDLGSGAGLPGLILAIMGVPTVHLIEADARKVSFLTEAARVTEIAIQIHHSRIETAPDIAADVVTARALAPLTSLIGHARRFLKPDGQCLFLKGGRVSEEVAVAQQTCHFLSTAHQSKSDPAGVVLQVENITFD